MIYIYILLDPRDGNVRYVGKTNGKQCRLKSHICSAKRGEKTHKANWVRLLLNEGLKPKLIIIDEILETNWEFWEEYWISQFKVWGFNLTNSTNGGENPPILTGHTEETKLKLSKIKKEYFKNNVHHIKGTKYSEERLIKARDRNKQCRAVIQKTKEGEYVNEYRSIGEAERETKICTVNDCLYGRQKTAGGYCWEFK
jgi:hypothetical protein